MTTNAQHTAGPWFAVPYGDGHDTVICKDEAGNQRIAFMAIPGSRDDQARRKKWAEIKANARLIAAAPELLEALETAMQWIKAWDVGFLFDDDWGADEAKINSAILKATGEPK